MVSQIIQAISIIPDMPRDDLLVDKQGYITTPWRLYFQQLTQALQTVISTEGLQISTQTTDDIDILTSDASLYRIIYDTTANTFKGNINVSGTPTWKTFTLT